MKRPLPKLKIERGIPLPDAFRPGYASVLRSMKVGESILFPPSDKSATVRKRASQALGAGNYVVRQAFDAAGKLIGTRVWRKR